VSFRRALIRLVRHKGQARFSGVHTRIIFGQEEKDSHPEESSNVAQAPVTAQAKEGLQGLQGDRGKRRVKGAQSLQGSQEIQQECKDVPQVSQESPQGCTDNIRLHTAPQFAIECMRKHTYGPTPGLIGPHEFQLQPSNIAAQKSTGPQGCMGIQGVQGIQRPQSIQEIQGPQGCQGPRGFQGSQGPKELSNKEAKKKLSLQKII
jgi:hypothetical protein